MSPEVWVAIAFGASGLFLSSLQLILNRGREVRTDERSLVERLRQIETTLLERVARAEARLDMIAPWVSAHMLHSPHNPYGIDPLLEKFASETFESAAEIRELAQRLIWIQAGDARAFRPDSSVRHKPIPERHRKLAAEVLEAISERYSLSLDSRENGLELSDRN